ncbi:hypothetical protein CRE_21791 [Caenorhabditis remanei]|uniref:Uncharacterized protein n=1 Tax=Caenorhabditis remanei TaxID=31234 RepID=E3MEH7_CAERE|nr:hypothetical protein CRE_21791 [Caenorhabditis remanei]
MGTICVHALPVQGKNDNTYTPHARSTFHLRTHTFEDTYEDGAICILSHIGSPAVHLWHVTDADTHHYTTEDMIETWNTSTSDYRFVRTHDTTGGSLLKFIGTRPTYDQSKFQHVPISKGSLILIHGLVVHKSEANTSDKSRHAYTVHVMERKNTKWSEDNWLQDTEDYKFPNLYKA